MNTTVKYGSLDELKSLMNGQEEKLTELRRSL